jgi:hypothetical protein
LAEKVELTWTASATPVSTVTDSHAGPAAYFVRALAFG